MERQKNINRLKVVLAENKGQINGLLSNLIRIRQQSQSGVQIQRSQGLRPWWKLQKSLMLTSKIYCGQLNK